MSGRLRDKVAIVVGAGQIPGQTIGNGRATAVLFAREEARVMAVDRRLDSALETERMIQDEGGKCFAFEADATDEESCKAAVKACVDTYGRVDILHNNVGVGEGDAGPAHLTEEAWDRIVGVNMKSVFLMCKHVLPIMREQGSGVITNISSVAATCATGIIAYKTSKAGVNAFTHSLAMGNAKYGIRANAILPPPTKPASSPASCSPWTAARARASASPRHSENIDSSPSKPSSREPATRIEVAESSTTALRLASFSTASRMRMQKSSFTC
jgi:NAD(P)-dependent dehydrogenase (short-subunit alcohol dehydrogenase family)